MPELPDVTVYIDALEKRLLGERLIGVRLASPFLVRTVTPPVDAVNGRLVNGLRRLGKRICIGFDDGIWFVMHLMIAGRLHWRGPGAELPGKRGLAAFDFAHGTLTLTESGSKKRASLHVVEGDVGLAEHRPPGIEVLESSLEDFTGALRSENHTIKRSLTDQRLLNGIGNAYSDEILHAAGMSPIAMTSKLSDGEIERLYIAARRTLADWTVRLRQETGDGFPEKVTAFRAEMAVHGKYRQPCPTCGTDVQRIVHAANETNYCPRCQTGGKLLADRALSTVLKKDWPRTIEALETRR
jgi:formamidopyrimidine-DNA glycosylase